ncbi:hypothetical protein [Actinomadura bangladeshensis]|uniref:Uncharacterized protein n=1 Tax=Actinomadura bangladeshensis TaxID=453573 RepID=A0A6L9QAP7_9ACTN|nr:hypothetical protein [Actinomadura bangladeshensis]NEA21590.1 hypothetical protein [Actinomadura bangladeshensis]NEA22550.1 hypothetical protein [Actinomadura bangladeshensis]
MTAAPSTRRITYGALAAAAISGAGCFTATLIAGLLSDPTGVLVGGILGVLLCAPPMLIGHRVGSRLCRSTPPGPPADDVPAPPDASPVLAALEAAAESARLADQADFAARIAAAECEAVGHRPGPDLGVTEVIAWGCTEPIITGPRCLRCGARLDPAEGNENTRAGVRMSKDITQSSDIIPDSDEEAR